MSSVPGCPPAFGWPNVFCPDGYGMAIEDVWPSLYVGADRVPEMRRKIEQLPWARDTLTCWQAEAEIVLTEEPRFVPGEVGGRVGMYATRHGQHLLFDPQNSQAMYDPLFARYWETNEVRSAAWTVLAHERLRRLMSSLAFLHAFTRDERYSRWVWRGLQSLAYDLYAPERRTSSTEYSLVYNSLYEAQAMLQLVQTVELVEEAPGCEPDILEAVRKHVFCDVGEAQSRWMDKMLVHNMSCWANAALALLGRYLGRSHWVEKAIFSQRAGLQMLLRHGVPRDPATGQHDGLWHETSTFYHFYALLPLIPLCRIGEELGAMDDDLRGRLSAMFDAPLRLCDPDLRMVALGDRLGPGTFYLPLMRHAYEYAAGQIDAERYGPILAALYEASGAPRTSLAAVAWGPDDLPQPPRLVHPLVVSAVLPAARLVTFRRETDRGQITCWFLGGEDNHPGQAHHHHDKLSISLHSFGRIVTSDLGLPSFQDNPWGCFLRSSLSHNTLLVDEVSQGPMECVAFDVDVSATIPWAYAAVRGNRDGPRASLWRTMLQRGDDVSEAGNDGVVLRRVVFFDPPYIVLLDRCEAPEPRRFAFVFHGYGSLTVRANPQGEQEAVPLPPLPATPVFRLFRPRNTANPAWEVIADWYLQPGLRLRMVTVSDGPFELTWGRTPANPRSETRGTVLLRAPGQVREFETVLELHRGTPTVRRIARSGELSAEVSWFSGSKRSYALEEVVRM